MDAGQQTCSHKRNGLLKVLFYGISSVGHGCNYLVTLSGANSDLGGDVEGDVLVFPGASRYNIAQDGTGPLLEALKAKRTAANSYTGASVFICGHTKRDARCGYCGPALLDALKQHDVPSCMQ
eukprot:535404-Amphidinium_carterae.1